MFRSRCFARWIVAALCCGGCGTGTHHPAFTVAPVFTVAEFDPSADPFADLAETVSQAQASGKRILLEIGGRW